MQQQICKKSTFLSSFLLVLGLITNLAPHPVFLLPPYILATSLKTTENIMSILPRVFKTVSVAVMISRRMRTMLVEPVITFEANYCICGLCCVLNHVQGGKCAKSLETKRRQHLAHKKKKKRGEAFKKRFSKTDRRSEGRK